MKMDKIELKKSYIDNRLKRFFSRGELDIDRSKCHESIRVYDILDLLKSENEIETDEEELEVFDIIEIIF